MLIVTAPLSGYADSMPGVEAPESAQLARLWVGSTAVVAEMDPSNASSDEVNRRADRATWIRVRPNLLQKKLVKVALVDGVAPPPESAQINLSPGDHSVSMVLKPAPEKYCFFVDDCLFAATSPQSDRDICVADLQFTAQEDHEYEIRWSMTETQRSLHLRTTLLPGLAPQFDYHFKLFDRTQSDSIITQESCQPGHS
jgi:hypothetical protein